MNLKTPAEIARMREGGQILGRVLRALVAAATEGVPLAALDKQARALIQEAGGQPAFLGYRPEGAEKPYPAAICTSINDVIVHGLPTNQKLKNGDLLKIDLGLLYKGFYTDTAATVGVGTISPAAQLLIHTTREALEKGIAACRPGSTLGDIGAAVQHHVESKKLKVIKGLTGHGIGRNLHEEPVVFNDGTPGRGLKLVPGMVLAIEPMVSAGSPRIRQQPDDSYTTSDGSLSAHFEHTVAITENGYLILTT